MKLDPDELIFGVAPSILIDCAVQLHERESDFDLDGFCQALGAPVEEARPVLEKLVHAGFAEPDGSDACRFHPTKKWGQLALANVSRMVGDTASGIEERLGPEYGDYARRAASSIENAANSIASKDPDELIDDTREFVRNSPGIALAGAAVVGFVVARLVKSGLGTSRSDDEEDDAA